MYRQLVGVAAYCHYRETEAIHGNLLGYARSCRVRTQELTYITASVCVPNFSDTRLKALRPGFHLRVKMGLFRFETTVPFEGSIIARRQPYSVLYERLYNYHNPFICKLCVRNSLCAKTFFLVSEKRKSRIKLPFLQVFHGVIFRVGWAE
jgi:hypothetical protein